MPPEDIRQELPDREETHRELRQKLDELRRDLQGQIDTLRTSTETSCSRFIPNWVLILVSGIAASVIAWLGWYSVSVLGEKIDKVEDGIAETRTLQQEMSRRVTTLEEMRLKANR